MSRAPYPRSIRSRLLLSVVFAVAVALAAMIAGFNVILDRSLSRDADRVVQTRVSAELGLLRAVGGKLVVGEAPDADALDSPVWVFSPGRTLEAPRAGAAVTAAAASLARGPERRLDVPSADIRLASAPVVVGRRRLGTVVAGVSLAPYEQTQHTALLGSLALGALLLLVVALAARWLLEASFRPVSRMTRQAADWSARDLDGRFSLGRPYDEVTELAATLDALLDRVAASLRHEQRFSAEISHELRTPLARVIAEAELALRRERPAGEYRAALEAVHRNAEQLSRTVDALVAAARHEADNGRGTADAYAVAQQTLEAVAGLAAERNVSVEVDAPAVPMRLGMDADLAERILQPVVENACRYGRGSVRVALAHEGTRVLYTIDDDGPGVKPDESESIFEPGVRGAAGRARSGAGGAGLGLALARRLARAASGEVDAKPSADGGRFVVSLPGI
ncbi:MAG: sensor histidine kinase [Gaiellaceae bacterium]